MTDIQQAQRSLPFILGSGSASRRSILANAGIRSPHIIVPDVDEDAIAGQCDGGPEDVVCELALAKAATVRHSDDLRSLLASLKGDDAGADADDADGDAGDDAGADADDADGGIAGVIVAGDSMLLIDGELQGKPHTVDEAIRRWHRQRGQSAQLITGHCVLDLARSSEPFVEAVSTTVHFADVSDTDIEAYANTGEPLPCAGAFTLEAIGGWFIDRIDGDPSSVIGLSLPLLRRALYHCGYHVSQFWDA